MGKGGDRKPVPMYPTPETFGELSQLSQQTFSDVTESSLDNEGIVMSHLTQGITGPEKARSTERVQLRQSLNPRLLTWKVKALSELQGIGGLVQLPPF